MTIQNQPTHNFVFFGTPEVARKTLERLLADGFRPLAVVTNPDAPKGRGLALSPTPVKVLAIAEGIPVLTPERLDEPTVTAIRELGTSYGVAVAYGKLFPESLIAAFPNGVLNVHYSLLPKYRGATPLEAALRAGERETGVTIQKMVKALDAGDIIAQEKLSIASDETARELRPRLIEAGAELLVKTLPAYERGEISGIPQDHALASHFGKLKKDDGLLDLSNDAETNWNTYRAYADSIGTYFLENEKRMKITKASFRDGKFVVERVIPEGKNEMPYANDRT